MDILLNIWPWILFYHNILGQTQVATRIDNASSGPNLQ